MVFSLFLAGMPPCFLPISSLLQGDLTICNPRPCHSVTEGCSPPSISSRPQCSWRCSSARTPDTRHSPSSSASGVSGDWLPELAKKKGQSSLLPAFCGLASPPVSADEPGPGTQALGARRWPLGPCQEASLVRRCPLSGFSGSLAPGDGNTAGRQGASRNRPWRTKERLLRPRCPQEGEEVSERS